MSRHNDNVYLMHMRDYVCEALKLSANVKREDLDNDDKLRYALLHLVCIVGEAASHVGHAMREKHLGIPWRNIIGMRNALVHGYDSVNLDILWDTIELELPQLLKMLETILSQEGGR